MEICKDCKQCNIYKVREYIINNFKGYDITSKCGACIVSFSLRHLLNSYEFYDPRSKKFFDEVEKNFEAWRDRYDYE